jgi:glycosyltransferase involved in cell wall biosynthesis
VANLAPVYREADVLVLTSDWEGTPNVVLEAMACALPVVATAVGGVPEIVLDEDTGFLVPPGDDFALDQALRRLIELSGLRRQMGAHAREYVLARHAVARLPERLVTLYSAVLS